MGDRLNCFKCHSENIIYIEEGSYGKLSCLDCGDSFKKMGEVEL